MKASISEIKCSVDNIEDLHAILMANKASFRGTDHQIDTYFKVDKGRLKIREGRIENSIIRYHRQEIKDIKESTVTFEKLLPKQVKGMKQILGQLFKVWKIVKKQRRIYFIDNVKFHLDVVESLGSFVEIEAIDTSGDVAKSDLDQQCAYYIDLLRLDKDSFIDQSYSDMVSRVDS